MKPNGRHQIVPESLRLLDSMNDAPGRVKANNALMPFGQFDTLQYARLLILDALAFHPLGRNMK
jgi:hypothetical protein